MKPGNWACCACDTTEKELRPYGPGGAPICFTCAMGTEESKAEAERQFAALLGAAPAMAIGSELGLQPLDDDGSPLTKEDA